jgi:hypothetical protein
MCAQTGLLDEEEFEKLMDKMGESMDADVSDLCTMFIEALTSTDDEREDSVKSEAEDSAEN